MGPKFDIVAVRKDGEEQTFTRKYDGAEITSQFRKVGAVWDHDGKMSLSFETALTEEDVADCWFNLYPSKGGKKKAGGEAKEGKKAPAQKAGPRKPAAQPKKAAVKPPADDPFEADETGASDDLDD